MNILVVEDVKEQRIALVRMIERSFIDCRVYNTDTVKEGIKIANDKEINLFFLDIELIDGSGIDLAKELRKINRYKLTGIIFITNNVIHIMEAFKEIHCYDFLVKPYNEEDVKNIIQTFSPEEDVKEKEGKYIMVSVDGCIKRKIYCEDIVYVEYANRNCNLKTISGNILVKGYGLNKIIQEVGNDILIQCHKAFAVNKKYIEKIIKVKPKVIDIYFWNCNDTIPLGYKYKNNIMEVLS
ncbi:MAG: response regulator transcription factor [Clostridiales bacterium]|nr:response regulator transcription factor [Clostridiales bacterium]